MVDRNNEIEKVYRLLHIVQPLQNSNSVYTHYIRRL